MSRKEVRTATTAKGRIQSEQQCPFSAACAAPYTFNYSYDLSGNMTGSNNGLSAAANSLTFGYSYNGAGQMNSASATSQPWNSTAYPSILLQANQTSPAAYDPMGHLMNGGLGLVSSGAIPALALGRQYDNRGRITTEIDDSITFYQIPSGGYAANGNVLQVNDLLLGDWTFGYDTLNRLTSVLVSSGPNQGDYGCWTYDPFGNRTLEAISTATVTPCAPGANDNAIFTPLTPVAGTNRMSNFPFRGDGQR